MKETATTTKERSADKPIVPRKCGFSQILVPTDFSPRSEAAIDCAVELARHLGAQVTLLHVVPEPSALDYTIGGIPNGLWEQAREQADKKLEDEFARVKLSYERVDTLVRTGSGLHQQIVSAATEVSADLVWTVFASLS
jgi:nucleotide-binding universal stress UspA family protein